MRKIASVVLLALLATGVKAQPARLRFSPEGDFKIAQFTDMHIYTGAEDSEQENKMIFDRLSRVARVEKPDVLIFTGDIVTSIPAIPVYDRLLDSLNTFKIPFCVTLGNHDAECQILRKEIASKYASSPYCLNRIKALGQEFLDLGIPVLSKDSEIAQLMLLCMDSGDYVDGDYRKGYASFTREQLEWMRRRNPDITSLAFFHIPLQEYGQTYAECGKALAGVRTEAECPGKENTGMFRVMKENGAVIGCFAGHDHDNNYIVEKDGIALVYGSFCGQTRPYYNLEGHGVRIITCRQGERSFTTWISMDDGSVKDRFTFTSKTTSK